MDGIASVDSKAVRGLQILEEKLKAETQGNVAPSTPSPNKKQSTSGASVRRSGPGAGLDMGRRLMVMVQRPNKADSKIAAAHDTGPEPDTQTPEVTPVKENSLEVVRIVEHGEHQKEAFRRLFDAQVMLGSLEQQLSEKESENQRLQKELAEARHNPYDLVRSDGKEKIVDEDLHSKATKGELNLKRQIPFWLQNDKISRMIVETCKDSLQSEQSFDDKASVLNHFWQCSLDMVMRWGGNPDELLLQQNKDLTEKCRTVQRNALKETAMIRNHTKKIEKKHQELQDYSKGLQKRIQDLQRALREALAGAQQGAGPAPLQMQAQFMALPQRRAPSPQNQAQPPRGKNANALRFESPPPVSKGPSDTRGRRESAEDIVQQWRDDARSGNSQQIEQPEPRQPATGGQRRTSSPNKEAAAMAIRMTAYQQQAMHFEEKAELAKTNIAAALQGAHCSKCGSQSFAFSGSEMPSLTISAASTLQDEGRSFDSRDLGGTGTMLQAGARSGGFFDNAPRMRRASISAATLPEADRSIGELPGGISLADLAQNGNIGGGFQSVDMRPSGMMSRDLLSPVQAASFDIGGDDGPDDEPAKGNHALSSDPNLMVNPSMEELEQMDNEIFELCDGFDDDMKELFIDAVDEKVRRILMLDPEKFKGGKLPFGIRPDGGNKALLKAEAEVERLQKALRDMEAELDAAKRALADAKLWRDPATRNQAPLRHMPVPEHERSASKSGRTSRQLSVKIQEDHHDDHEAARRRKDAAAAALTGSRRELKHEEHDRHKKDPTEGRGFHEHSGKGRGAMGHGDQDSAERLRRLEEENQRLRSELRALHEKSVQTDAEYERALREMKDAMAANDTELKRAVDQLYKMDRLVAHFLGQKSTSKHEREVEKLIGRGAGGGDAKAHRACVDHLEHWTTELVKSFEMMTGGVSLNDLLTKTGGSKSPLEDALQRELERLKQLCASQEKEIARLLTLVDELRARLAMMPEAAKKAGNGVEKAVHGVLGHVGLKDMIEAGNTVPRLREVFERLYQDAVQRIQRHTLIKQQVQGAKDTFAELVTQGQGITAPAIDCAEGINPISDFEQLSATTNATLKGMWYHSSYIFKRTCEYAVEQGVEDSLSQLPAAPLSELIREGEGPVRVMIEGEELAIIGASGGGGDVAPSGAEQPASAGASRRRLTPVKTGALNSPLVSETFSASPFWKGELPGGVNPDAFSPRRIRKAALEDPEPGSFTSYVAALRAARCDLGTAEWPRAQSKPTTASKGGSMRSLKVAVSYDRGSVVSAGGVGGTLGGSRSMPTLPVRTLPALRPQTPTGTSPSQI